MSRKRKDDKPDDAERKDRKPKDLDETVVDRLHTDFLRLIRERQQSEESE